MLALISALAPVPVMAEPALRYPPDTLLLLVAPWCAPCHGELARLDAIVAAARPLTVQVVAIEDNPRARAMVGGVAPRRRWTPPEDDARRYRADLMARAAGLPFSVATDAAGHVCAGVGGGLNDARIAALLARCRAGS